MIERLERWLSHVEPASGATIAICDASPQKTNLSASVGQATELKPIAMETLPSSTADYSRSSELDRKDVIGSDAAGARDGCSGAVHNAGGFSMPEFPLLPVSKGFVITCRKSLQKFRDVLLSTK